MDETLQNLRGRYVVFDGPDGCGKSTQVGLLADRLTESGGEVVRAVDPGGTPTGQRIREILLGHETGDLNPACETLLFMASRAQLVHEVVRPALLTGRTVLGDRFITSTLAYQGALGMSPEEILRLGAFAVELTWPDLTILLDLPAEEGLRRAEARNAARAGTVDRMEARAMEYHRQVRETFRRIGKEISYPGPICHVSAEGSPADVQERILACLQEELP